MRAVSESLEKAAGQLADAVEAGQRGEIHGVATGPGTVYHPLIVTYEPLPSHPLAAGTYARIIHRGGRLAGDGIKPVTLINTRDVEALEALISGGAVSWPVPESEAHIPVREAVLPSLRVRAGTGWEDSPECLPRGEVGTGQRHDRDASVRTAAQRIRNVTRRVQPVSVSSQRASVFRRLPTARARTRSHHFTDTIHFPFGPRGSTVVGDL